MNLRERVGFLATQKKETRGRERAVDGQQEGGGVGVGFPKLEFRGMSS